MDALQKTDTFELRNFLVRSLPEGCFGGEKVPKLIEEFWTQCTPSIQPRWWESRVPIVKSAKDEKRSAASSENEARKIDLVVEIDFLKLEHFSPESWRAMIISPVRFLEETVFEELVAVASILLGDLQVKLYEFGTHEDAEELEKMSEGEIMKTRGMIYDILQWCRKIRTRKFVVRPLITGSEHFKVNRLLPRHKKSLVQITGSIVRMTSKRLRPAKYLYRCSTCKDTGEVDVPLDDENTPKGMGISDLVPPYLCEKCKINMVHSQTVWIDYAECRVQQKSHAGHLPRGITVILTDELCTKISVGQSVEVTGMVTCRWKGLNHGGLPQADLVLRALNAYKQDPSAIALDEEQEDQEDAGRTQTKAEVHAKTQKSVNKEPFQWGAMLLKAERDAERYLTEQGISSRHAEEMEHWKEKKIFHDVHPKHQALIDAIIRTKLTASVCPQLSGYFAQKAGILLAAAGGVTRVSETGMKSRGLSHILFVGDPATGKSQLLKFASALAPRGVSTAGMTSTTAGLTVAAVKEFGEWTLEPGALVLSDGGVCAIDELRLVSAQDRRSLHEAMEQQTISVAKAGLMAQLKTETSVVAACNPPKDRSSSFSGGERLQSDTGVGGPLLSRFDLIFLMYDNFNMDAEIAEHVLNMNTTFVAADAPGADGPPLSLNELRNVFLAEVRDKYSSPEAGPELTESASIVIEKYYMLHRVKTTSNLTEQVPITVRFLEGLIRFTQAHAKVLKKDVADEYDALLAIFLVERTAHSLALFLNREGEPEVRTSDTLWNHTFLDVDEKPKEKKDGVEGTPPYLVSAWAQVETLGLLNTRIDQKYNLWSGDIKKVQRNDEILVEGSEHRRHKRGREDEEGIAHEYDPVTNGLAQSNGKTGVVGEMSRGSPQLLGGASPLLGSGQEVRFSAGDALQPGGVPLSNPQMNFTSFDYTSQ